jgi:hypothetical protein
MLTCASKSSIQDCYENLQFKARPSIVWKILLGKTCLETLQINLGMIDYFHLIRNRLPDYLYTIKETQMKSAKIIFWISTILIFLFEGVMPALTSQTEMAKEGIRHLGYPAYFGIMLTVFKVLGALALIIPQVPARVKEWAYAGLTIDFLSAFISTWVINGLSGLTFFPLVVLAVLIVSYINYHKIKDAKAGIAI